MQNFIENTLKNAFPDAEIHVVDTTGGGDHFDVDITTAAFAGRSVLQQHRLVYAALGEKVGYEIHALALNTHIPG